MQSKITIYTRTALILSLLLAVLRALCFLLYFDGKLGYFNPTFPVLVTNALTCVSALWCASALFFLPKDTIATKRLTDAPITKGVVAIAATLVMGAGIGLVITNVSSGNRLALICGCLILAGSAFVWSRVADLSTKNAQPILGMLLILGLLFVLITSHFDMFVTINSPIKTGLHLSVIAAALFLLTELRFLFEDEMPRAGLAAKLLTVLFCFPTATGHLALYFSGNAPARSQETLTPFFSLALLGLSIFAAARLFAVRAVLATSQEDEEKEIEKI